MCSTLHYELGFYLGLLALLTKLETDLNYRILSDSSRCYAGAWLQYRDAHTLKS